ncbi:MAG: hypothetical protein ABEJ35_00085 [Halobacteriaceae archaeon]
MLNVSVSEFNVEFDEGAIKNVGSSNKRATAKLWDVEDATIREYGDRRVKLVATDESGNEIQVAMFPEQARALAADVEELEDESRVFE